MLLCLLSICPPAYPQSLPLWVRDINAAYPEREWLCVLGFGADRESAEKTALGALAQVFSVDIQSEIIIKEEFSRTMRENNGKQHSLSAGSEQIREEIAVSTRARDLIGVQTESWMVRDGEVYANARMNRRECAALYSSAINTNENLIRRLREDAEKSGATLEASKMLNAAVSIAERTDYFYRVRSILYPENLFQKPEYGNADTLRILARNTAGAIVIGIEAGEDESGRITKTLASFFTQKGFRIETGGTPSYRLSVILRLKDADDERERFRYVDYTFRVSLRDQAGREIFTYSRDGSQGHRTFTGARERCVTEVEELINTGDGDFALRFEAYLSSLSR
jgi:hypothetical protein